MMLQQKPGRCGSQDRLTVPQMRAMLELIRQNAEADRELDAVLVHVRKAVDVLDAVRDVALAVMREADAETASRMSEVRPKLC